MRRSRSSSRARAPAARPRSAACRRPAWRSARSPTSRPSRTTAAARPSGAGCRGARWPIKPDPSAASAAARAPSSTSRASKCIHQVRLRKRSGLLPGQHGLARRRKACDYGIQLRAKQKARRIYGVLEKPVPQLLRERRDAQPGVTGIRPAAAARAAARQRRLPAGPCRLAQQARQLVSPPALQGQRPHGQHRLRPGAARRRRRGSRAEPQDARDRERPALVVRRGRCPTGSRSTPTALKGTVVRFPSAKRWNRQSRRAADRRVLLEMTLLRAVSGATFTPC